MSDTADGPLTPEQVAEIGRRADISYAESYAKDVATLRAEIERLRTCLDSAHEHRRVVQARADKAEAETERLRQDLDEAGDELNTAHLATVDALAEVERLRAENTSLSKMLSDYTDDDDGPEDREAERLSEANGLRAAVEHLRADALTVEEAGHLLSIENDPALPGCRLCAEIHAKLARNARPTEGQ